MTEQKSKLASALEVARGYLMVGAAYAKTTASAVVSTVRGEPEKKFTTTIVYLDKDGKEKVAAPDPAPVAAAQKPAEVKQPRVRPVVAEKSSTNPPAVSVPSKEPVKVEPPTTQPQAQIEVVKAEVYNHPLPPPIPAVEAELVEPEEAKRINAKFDELKMQSMAMDEMMTGFTQNLRMKL